MRTLASLGLLLSLVLPTSGCIVVPRHGYFAPSHRAHQRAVSRGTVCPPSHRWDGYVCRHRGEGRGARKHDVHRAVPVR